MCSKFNASIGAGLAGGIMFGVMMQMMTAPTPDGGSMSVMAMIGQMLGSPTAGVGWLFHLFNSALIGAIFGWLLGGRLHAYGSALTWGAAYGFAWWILGGLVLMPMLLGMPAFAPLVMAPMRMVAMGSLVGHLVYGAILGGTFMWLHHGVRDEAPAHA